MIVAVLESFPETTQTFHHHRLAELHRRGLVESIWYVRTAEGCLPEGCEELREIAQQIPRPTIRDLLRFMRTGLFAKSLVTPERNNGERGRLGALKYGAYGASLGRKIAHDSSAPTVHAMFAAASATTAAIAADVAQRRLSVEVHSPQTLVRNQEWLAAKLQLADDLIAISDYSAQAIRPLAPEAHIHIVRCGIPDNHYPADLPLDGEAIDLIAVGSLISKKGHDIAIRAAAMLNRSLTIIGEGPLRDELTDLATELGATVDLRGAVPPDEVRRLLMTANVGVLACVRSNDGDEDGIPVALMEYLHAGLPTVSTSVAGIPELLHDDSVGLLVEPGNPEALASAIEKAEHELPRGGSRLPMAFHLATSCDALVAALDLVETGS